MTLDERLRHAAGALTRHVDAEAPLEVLDRRSRRGRRRRATGALAGLVVVAAGIGVLAQDDNDVDVAAGGDGMVEVTYERAVYSQEAQLDCPGEELGERGTFSEATFEAWADRDGRRWRNTVTYPNDATRHLIAVGSPWYPDELFVRGALRGAVLGCADDRVGILVTEPGQNTFFSLNPLDEIPTIAGLGGPAVPGYADWGVRIAGEHADSQGRPVELWRQEITGFVGTSDLPTERFPVMHTVEWFVEVATGDVLEKTIESRVDGIGVVRSTMTRFESSIEHVPTAFLDTAGFEQVDLDDGGVGETISYRCPNTTHGFEQPPRPDESGDGLPPAGTATRELAEAVEEAARRQYDARASNIADVPGRAWSRNASGKDEIKPERVSVVVLTLDDVRACPGSPAFFNGAPLVFHYRRDE